MKLIYYKFPYGFDDAIAYTDSLELFLDLWDEWLESQLLKLIKNTPMDDWWHYMGGGSWEFFLPSFYYTHTEEKIGALPRK